MITRKFDQEWEQQKSSINNMTEYDVLFDFYEYLKKMMDDLNKINKYYATEFNSVSSKSIQQYMNIVSKRFNQFNELCLKKEAKSFSYDYNNIKEEIYVKNGNNYRINDKYYNVLSKIAESVFKIEDEVAKIVENAWIDSISSVDDYSPDGQYTLLAHADYKTYADGTSDEELIQYNSKQQGLCFSLITDKKTRIFDQSTSFYNYYAHSDGLVGIIAKPQKDSLISMSYDDMLSTEYIDGKCALSRHFNHSNVNRCYANNGSEIFSKGTKIMLPSGMFDISVDTINEVILDSNKIDVVAVFYVKDRNREIPKRFETYKQLQEEKCGHKLKTIELFPRNRLKQYNLEEIMSNC